MWYASKGGCADNCKIRQEGINHSGPMVGGHMELKNYHRGWWYILPICNTHNAPWGQHDRGRIPDWPLLTKKNALAVEIHPYF